MPTIPMILAKDVQGQPMQIFPPSKNIFSAKLVTGVASSITIPSDFPEYIVIINNQQSTNIWCDLSGATAVAATSGTLVAGTAELIPVEYMFGRLVPAGTNLSLITDTATAEVSVLIYAGNAWGR